MIEFSIPLLFQNNYIEKITNLNKSLNQSQITSVYNCFPMNLPNKCGYEQIRMVSIPEVRCQDDFFNQVKKAQDAGLEFIYLLNSPKSLNFIEFYQKSDNINTFAELLLSNNVKILRVTNTQLIDYLSANYPEFEIRTSTSQEYTNIKQYKNLFNSFPNITEVVPSWDLNRNFKFLKSFNELFDKKIELMVNEGCLAGCPFRTHHNIFLLSDFNITEKEYIKIPERFKTHFSELCEKQYFNNLWENMILANIIYPWQINTYVEKYNIAKFKLVGRNTTITPDLCNNYFDFYSLYLKGIEDFDVIKDLPFNLFNNYIFQTKLIGLNNIKIKDIIDYLPKIEHFEKNGQNCLNVCGTECKYCYNIANELKTKYPITL